MMLLARLRSPIGRQARVRQAALLAAGIGLCITALRGSAQTPAAPPSLAQSAASSQTPAPPPAVTAPVSSLPADGVTHAKSEGTQPKHLAHTGIGGASERFRSADGGKDAWRQRWLRKWQAVNRVQNHKVATVAKHAAPSEPAARPALKHNRTLKSQASSPKSRSASLKPVRSAKKTASRKTHADRTPKAAVVGTALPANSDPKQSAHNPLSEAKPDSANPSLPSSDRPQDSPFTAIGDAWKMLLYLAPMLLVIVGCLHLLRKYQQRTGRLPAPVQAVSRLGGKQTSRGVLNALVGSFHLNNVRQRAGSNIRLVESVPIGSTNLHLIEVRGRLLLLGATGASVTLLTEFEEQLGVGDGDFRALLRAAATDIDALDLSEPDLPATAMVTSLEEMMHETGEAVTRRLRRLRTVQEAEDAYEQG